MASPPVPNLPPYDGGRYPYGLTRSRLLRAYVWVPFVLLAIVIFDLPNWLLLLAYLLASVPFVFEMPIRRLDILTSRSPRSDLDAWIEELPALPVPAQRYWRDAFLTVETIAQTHRTSYWNDLDDRVRWMVVAAVELQTKLLLDHFEDPEKYPLPIPPRT